MENETTLVSVRSGGRCGELGLKMFGFHFLPDPQTLDLSGLEPWQVERLLSHPELIIENLAAESFPSDDTGKPATADGEPKAKRKRKGFLSGIRD